MPMYVHKDNQQFGPYEAKEVLDQLRNGSLSPEDIGIEQGGVTWQKLGAMFPGVGIQTPTGFPVSTGNPVTVQSKTGGGGCLKGVLLGLGIVMLVVGIGTAIGSRFIPSVSCDLLEKDHQEIVKLQSDLDQATKNGDSEKIRLLQFTLNQTLSAARASQEHCDEEKFRNNIVGGAGAGVALIGLLMTAVGLFLGRNK